MANYPRRWQLIIIPKLHVSGITLYPFIFIVTKKLKQNKVFINHEHIHLRQQLEMLIIPFYICYLLNYLINRIKYKTHHHAYLNICFEREAYANEAQLGYLKARKLWTWRHYL